MKKVAAILVTYNRLELLKKSINALENQSFPLEHIIIINNNSNDGTDSYLEKYRGNKKYIVVNSNENLGGAGGFNLGMKKAYNNTDDDYFWIMDDDTIPEVEALQNLLNSANFLNDQFGYLCSNVYWKDGTASNIPKTSNSWTRHAKEGLVETTEATFVSVFTTRIAVRKVGFPISDIFIWGDDTEYTLRLCRYKKSYLVVNSLVLHKSAQKTVNLTLVSDDSERLPRYFYLIRNVMYIRKKYYNDSLIKLTIKHLKIAYNILLRSNDRKLKRLKILSKGYIAGVKFNPKIERVINDKKK